MVVAAAVVIGGWVGGGVCVAQSAARAAGDGGSAQTVETDTVETVGPITFVVPKELTAGEPDPARAAGTRVLVDKTHKLEIDIVPTGDDDDNEGDVLDHAMPGLGAAPEPGTDEGTVAHLLDLEGDELEHGFYAAKGGRCSYDPGHDGNYLGCVYFREENEDGDAGYLLWIGSTQPIDKALAGARPALQALIKSIKANPAPSEDTASESSDDSSDVNDTHGSLHDSAASGTDSGSAARDDSGSDASVDSADDSANDSGDDSPDDSGDDSGDDSYSDCEGGATCADGGCCDMGSYCCADGGCCPDGTVCCPGGMCGEGGCN
jgi:hypothetical protein